MGTFIDLVLTTYNEANLLVSPIYSIELQTTIEDALEALASETTTLPCRTELLDVQQDNSNLNIYYWSVINYSSVKYGLVNEYKTRDDTSLNTIQLKALDKIKHSIEELEVEHLKTLMDVRFTINDLYDLFNCSKDKTYDKGNFYKLMKNHKVLKKTAVQGTYVNHRPPIFYEFK